MRRDLKPTVQEESDKKRLFEPFILGAATVSPFFFIQLMSGSELLEGAGDLLLVPWMTVIAASVGILGYKRDLQAPNLLVLTLLGMLISFSAMSVLLNLGIVSIAIAAIMVPSIVLGTWISFEVNRIRGNRDKNLSGSWRIFFIFTLILPLIAFLLLL